MATTFKVNGQSKTVDVPADMPLLWVLRDLLDLKGTKFGCGIAQCGACTVHVDGRPVRSCMLPAANVGSREVTTIEAIAQKESGRRIQAAWLELEVVQCGYCQSGQIMSAAALIERNPIPDDAEIDAAMAGNICRCATYARIRAQMTGPLAISRRKLIVGGLMVAFACSARSRAATSEATSPSAIGGFVRISQEGGISLVMPSVEMGQGIYTAEAALLAEELDVRLDQIVAIAAPPDASLYAQPLFKAQLTGGSTSIRGFWIPLRQAGAAARSMLVAAAAQAWRVHPDECSTKDGTVLHSSTGRVLRYGEVAESAATLPIPEDPKLKSPGDFRIIGKSQRRIDTPAKVNGSAVYGIDVAGDGMKTAA